MSMFSNSVDKILKGAHFLIADLEQHAKNMLKDVSAHSETIAQATEKKLAANAEYSRAVMLAERFRNFISLAEPKAGTPATTAGNVKPVVPANNPLKKPNAM